MWAGMGYILLWFKVLYRWFLKGFKHGEDDQKDDVRIVVGVLSNGMAIMVTAGSDGTARYVAVLITGGTREAGGIKSEFGLRGG